MKIEVSIDDGLQHDMRAADMLKHYGFRGIFFVPIDRMELRIHDLNEIAKHHEIGAHTMTHPQDLKLVEDHKLKWELTKPFSMFDMILENKQPITKFCYPRGRFDERVKRAVKDAGYEYARTVRIGSTKLSDDPFEIETSMHLFYRQEYGDDTLEGWFERMLEQAQDPAQGYFHLWFHTNEIESFNLWQTLEKFLKELSKYND